MVKKTMKKTKKAMKKPKYKIVDNSGRFICNWTDFTVEPNKTYILHLLIPWKDDAMKQFRKDLDYFVEEFNCGFVVFNQNMTIEYDEKHLKAIKQRRKLSLRYCEALRELKE